MTDPFRRRTAGGSRRQFEEDVRQQRWRAMVISGALLALAAAAFVALRLSDEPDLSTADEPPATTQPAPTTTAAPPARRLVVESVTFDEARDTVDSFLASVRAGDIASAATLWSGYPDAQAGDAAAIQAGIGRFAADFPWLAAASPAESYVGAAGGFNPLPVVTVVGAADPGQSRPAAAFVVGALVAPGTSGQAQIQRLPAAPPEHTMDPAPGTAVGPNQELRFDAVPVEGGAAAYVNGSAVTARIDHGAKTTIVELPDFVPGDLVVTISLATEEIPSADAFWFPGR